MGWDKKLGPDGKEIVPKEEEVKEEGEEGGEGGEALEGEGEAPAEGEAAPGEEAAAAEAAPEAEAPAAAETPAAAEGEAAAGETEAAAAAAGEASAVEPAGEAAGVATQPLSLVFVLGGPGSGKGTQCARIVETFGYTHLSTGDLLRAETESGSELGVALKEVMAKGELVSTDQVLALLKKAMVEASGGGETLSGKFLVDGFPRSMDQVSLFEASIATPTLVLAFEASEEVLEERLVNRGKTSGREDDNVESIRKRFATFREQSAPVIAHYSATRPDAVKVLNSERSVDDVYGDVVPVFEGEVARLSAAAAAAAAAAAGAPGEGVQQPVEGGAPAGPPPPPPPPPPTDTGNARKVWEAVVGAVDETTTVDGAWLISTLALYKTGFGEAALRFAFKAADHSGSGALLEMDAWRALSRCMSSAPNPIQRTHLRKAWRVAEKFVKPEEEGEGGEGEEGGEEGAAAAPTDSPPTAAPEDPKVLVESFLTTVLEDEAVASLFNKEVPIPIEAPPEPVEEEGAPDEE